jgi:hypothetical protein
MQQTFGTLLSSIFGEITMSRSVDRRVDVIIGVWCDACVFVFYLVCLGGVWWTEGLGCGDFWEDVEEEEVGSGTCDFVQFVICEMGIWWDLALATVRSSFVKVWWEWILSLFACTVLNQSTWTCYGNNKQLAGRVEQINDPWGYQTDLHQPAIFEAWISMPMQTHNLELFVSSFNLTKA